MEVIKFRNYGSGFQAYRMRLSIGDELEITHEYRATVKPNCRFIKVTPKGFNILDLDTDRTILKTHLYAKGMAGKKFANKGVITGDFWIPSYCRISIKNKQQEKIS